MFRVLSLLVFTALPVSSFAQAPVSTAPSLPKPSELVQPAIDNVAKAGSSVDLNRWKGSNSVRSEADSNLASIQKDLQGTLPQLLTAADAAPNSPSASIPVLLNLDALYSVLLRISISSAANAPRDQSETINGSLATLDGARRDLGERIAKLAAAQEKQIAALQTALQQQAATIAAAQQQAATPPPPPPAKPKKKKPAAAKPAATKPATPAPAPAQ